MIKMASWCSLVLVSMCLVACGSSSGGGSGGAATGGPEDCTRACNNSAALHCPNDKPGDCASACQIQTSIPICKQEFAALAACSANAPVACGSDGKAAVQGCNAQGLAYASCFFGGLLDGGLPD